MAVEREIKLTIANQEAFQRLTVEIPRLLAEYKPVLSKQVYQDLYVDSPDLSLLRHRLALRFRQSADKRWMTLKGNGGVVNGVSIRSEWEEPLDFLPMSVDQLPVGEIRERVVKCLPPGADWQTLMQVTLERLTLDIRLPEDCLVELALDDGQVLAGGQKVRFWELELEAKGGEFSCISQLAEDMAKRYTLAPANHSKFSLGLQLAGIQLKDLPPIGEERAIY
ncbi:MAG: CYTH domain-containing protein [Magnetococcales bacterium]|nr:CYTH domain-containing protein [Magnetococcales bacterium]NGZ25670.1 CYTH domain-containing protein [Magnetococcales bacterium]